MGKDDWLPTPGVPTVPVLVRPARGAPLPAALPRQRPAGRRVFGSLRGDDGRVALREWRMQNAEWRTANEGNEATRERGNEAAGRRREQGRPPHAPLGQHQRRTGPLERNGQCDHRGVAGGPCGAEAQHQQRA